MDWQKVDHLKSSAESPFLSFLFVKPIYKCYYPQIWDSNGSQMLSGLSYSQK